MKNLKRLMSVVLSVVMLLSFVISTSAATFTDVAETDSAFEAIEVLAALDILEGKEAGVFDPEANIKRSEFAAVICRAMNQSPVGVATFVDVPEDHWAYDYIAWAASQNIVKGKGEGKFDPDANVTYNEAITMIVRAMGYEYYVEEFLGGFPTGYTRIAGSYKIDKGVNTANGNAAASRADVAQLVYNAFDAPLMDYNYAIGSDMEYVIYNGSKNVDEEKRTLLSYYSDIYKVKAVVDKTFKNALGYVDNKGNLKMDLTVASTYGFDEEWIEDALGKKINTTTHKTLSGIFANNEVWAEYAGYTVDAYITLNEAGKLEVVAMVPVASGEELVIENAREMVITSTLVDTSVPADAVADVVDFVYEDENGNDEKVNVDLTATLYYNNVLVGAINAAGQAIFEGLDDETYPSVTLMDSDDNGSFDKVYVTDYVYGIVEEVDADYEIIETTDNNVFELSEDDTKPGFVYNIYKDGSLIGIEDLVAGDMLNVVIGDTSGNVANATFVDIYVTNNTIESSVSSVAVVNGANRYAINGENYFAASTALCGTLKPGDAGIFYITIDGYIYDVEKTSAHSDNYGFILEMGKSKTAFGETWQIKILDKNNNVKVLPVKDSMFVTNAKEVAGSPAAVQVASYGRRQYKEADGSLSLMMADIATLLESTTNAAAVEANIDDRLVTFKEVNGEITELVFATAYSSSTVDEFNKDSNTNLYFNKNAGRLGNMEVLDSSVLFAAPASAITSKMVGSPAVETWYLNADKVQVYAQSGLKDAQTYTGYLYNIDANRAFGAAVVTAGMAFAGDANALAVITSKSTGLDAAGNTVTVLTVIQSGETKTLTVTDGEDSLTYTGVGSVEPGDVIQYTVNAAGEINKAKLVYDFSAKQLMDEGVANQVEFKLGVVKATTGKVIDLDLGDLDAAGPEDDKEHDSVLAWDLAEDSTNVLVDVARMNKSNGFDAKSGTSYIRAYRENSVAGDGSGAITTDVYVAVVRVDDGVAVDVVAYKYAKDNTVVTGAGSANAFTALFTIN